MPDLLSRLFVQKAEDESEQLLIKESEKEIKEEQGQDLAAQ